MFFPNLYSKCVLNCLPDAEAVDDLHGEGGDVELLDHRPLGRVHVADADEGEPAGREAAEKEMFVIESYLGKLFLGLTAGLALSLPSPASAAPGG